MKIALIGTVDFSYSVLKHLIKINASIVGVCTQENTGKNADWAELSPLCQSRGVDCYITEDINNSETLAWFEAISPDVILCVGISSIIKAPLLGYKPIIGFHPAALPHNRGRHPVIWALALGLEKTASTFFFMDEGADSGDILSQTPVEIGFHDNAQSLYQKITKTALKQIEDFLPLLENGDFPRLKQDNSKVNYWRKRGLKDGQIDFRMSSLAIYNLVRALSKPYPGAHIAYKGQNVSVWQAKMIESDLTNIEPGKVLAIKDNALTVKTADGAISLIKHDFEIMPKVGEYL